MNNKEAFSAIYKNHKWGSGVDAPLSGSGSNALHANTYVEIVKNFIESQKISSVLDLGHGDWAMWKNYKFDGIDYVGIDVAEGLSEVVSKEHGDKNRKFISEDFTKLALPEAELLITKDALQHLSNADVIQVLNQINKYRFVIICNDIFFKENLKSELRRIIQLRSRIKTFIRKKNPFYSSGQQNNIDIHSGEVRGIDLESSPFYDFIKEKKVLKMDYSEGIHIGIKKRIYVLCNS